MDTICNGGVCYIYHSFWNHFNTFSDTHDWMSRIDLKSNPFFSSSDERLKRSAVKPICFSEDSVIWASYPSPKSILPKCKMDARSLKIVDLLSSVKPNVSSIVSIFAKFCECAFWGIYIFDCSGKHYFAPSTYWRSKRVWTWKKLSIVSGVDTVYFKLTAKKWLSKPNFCLKSFDDPYTKWLNTW